MDFDDPVLRQSYFFHDIIAAIEGFYTTKRLIPIGQTDIFLTIEVFSRGLAGFLDKTIYGTYFRRVTS